MKKAQYTPVLLVIAALLGACSSTPTTTGLLDQTRTDFQVAQNNPKIATYAAVEMNQADEAMKLANAAAADDDSAAEIDNLAYVAKQKIALAQETAKQKSAEAEVANAGKERDQLRLDQRTSEADQARREALQAKNATDLAQRNAALAQGKTQVARERAAILEAQLADLAAKETARGMIITFGDVLFGTDLARLTPVGMNTAQKLADVLQQNPERTVLVEGFTDSTGSTSHNQELSERRATSVRSVLQAMGVASERIAVRGYGEAYPVAANDTGPNRQLNRRVEIVLSNSNRMIQQR
jgi:outer membrane protein OmpA-like peptidoglycan-associated protein